MRHTVFTPGHSITLRDYRKPIRKRHSKHVGPYTWRVGDSDERPTGRGFYQASDGLHMDAHGSSFCLRLMEANDAKGLRAGFRRVSRYALDEEGDGYAMPIVALRPHGRGYLPGYTLGEGMCASLDLYVCTTQEEAAILAHHITETMAEAERERAAQEAWDEAHSADVLSA